MYSEFPTGLVLLMKKMFLKQNFHSWSEYLRNGGHEHTTALYFTAANAVTQENQNVMNVLSKNIAIM